MKECHYSAGVLTLVALLAASMVLPRTAAAQDLDPYHSFIVEFLANEYNIEGGEFLLGTNLDAKLDQGAYGTGTVKTRQPADPDLGYEYIHTENIVQTNPWDSGITWPSTTPVEAGDTGLAVAIIRGESAAGGLATVNIFVERAGGDFFKFMNQDSYTVDLDWRLVAFPFTWTEPFAPGGTQFGLHLSHDEQFVDITAPVVLNFGDRYTPEVLQGLIDSGGQIPLVASFTQDVVRGVPPFSVNFDASLSSAPGSITDFSWDFGDGGAGTGQTVSHEYTAEGIYEVILTITDDTGAMTRDTSQVVGFDGLGLPETPLQIPYTAAAPTIDGEIDAAWGDAVEVDIDFHANDDPPVDDNDVSGSARAMWDGQNLYVLYEVTDDVLNNDAESSWQDDAVDLYVDGLNEKAVTYDDNDAQYEFSWGDDTFTITGNAVGNGRAEGVEYRYATAGNGYVIEASIPWSNVATLPVPGSRIGIEFMINDGDLSGAVRDTKLSWYALTDVAFQNPSVFATAELVGGEGQVIAAAFSWTPTAVITEIPITFDATPSVAPGPITSYTWDFGDGETGEGATVEHTFAEPGSYTVTLTITDDQANTQSVGRTVVVSDGLGTAEKPLEVPLTETAPTIDGTMEDIWSSNAVSVVLQNLIAGEALTSETDLAPTAYAMWDATNMYVFFDVVDDALISNDSETERWQDDQVEFFLDANNSKTENAHDDDDAQFSMTYDFNTLQGDAAGKYPNTQWVAVSTATGWALEAAIPWADVGATALIGMEIGIDFQVNDDDDGGARDHKVAWYGTTDNAWQWAHVFAYGVLTDALIVGVEEEDGLPERFAIESVYPNPFNPRTTAMVSVREPGAYEARVYNVLGQLVEERLFEVQTPGQLEIGFDLAARASGLYLISVKHKASGKTVTARATLLK